MMLFWSQPSEKVVQYIVSSLSIDLKLIYRYGSLMREYRREHVASRYDVLSQIYMVLLETSSVAWGLKLSKGGQYGVQ